MAIAPADALVSKECRDVAAVYVHDTLRAPNRHERDERTINRANITI